MALNLFKLEKLTIRVADGGKKTPLGIAALGGGATEFVTMFNPTSYKQTYAIEWRPPKTANASGGELMYHRSPPRQLEIQLLLDGTGVDEDLGILAIGRQSVEERVADFLAVAYDYQGEGHQPNRLVVEWGNLNVNCRLSQVDVNYTLFGRGGEPLRAELNATFLTEEELERRLKKEDKMSPDVTHSRVVAAGDTLPLLTRDIYGSAEHYLDVARHNGLDDFRLLEPGRALVFPPLESLTGGG